MKVKLLKSICNMKNLRNLFPAHAREKGGTEAFNTSGFSTAKTHWLLRLYRHLFLAGSN